jgi:nicotinate-nucleotide adenylyltransferase
MIEINRTGPSYTIDTMLELRDMTGDENEIFFILGFDSLAGFPRWKDPERLIQLCRLVAVPRPGCAVPDLATLEKEVPGLSKNIIIMDEPHTDISATKIRDRVAKGLSIRQLVPTPVEEYIRKHKLYLKR